jgi:APA family basic amino acid/polyamine antiporter
MIGTGVFAVWQPALQRAGGLLIPSVVVAATVAALNATSTARLAARNPEAGGVYAYGRIHVNRFAGVLAGSVFIMGKTASASAAALTIGLYVWPENSRVVALAAVGFVLALNLRGVVRSTRVAAVMVIVVALVLLGFVLGSGVELADADVVPSVTLVEPTPLSLLAASGLVFVAFAGYARITVLGEEVTDPRRTIPLAIACSFGLVLLVYLLVAVVVVLAAGRGVTIGPAALNDIAQALLPDWTVAVLAIAAVLAAGAVLVSLIAGVGRTLFAMADRGDAPRAFAAVGRTRRIPYRGIDRGSGHFGIDDPHLLRDRPLGGLAPSARGRTRGFGGTGGARSGACGLRGSGARLDPCWVTNLTLAAASACACICKH